MSLRTSEIHEIGPSSFEQYNAKEPSILFLPGSNDSEDETSASFSIVLTTKSNMQISEVMMVTGIDTLLLRAQMFIKLMVKLKY